jgi:hypothetical protein
MLSVPASGRDRNPAISMQMNRPALAKGKTLGGLPVMRSSGMEQKPVMHSKPRPMTPAHRDVAALLSDDRFSVDGTLVRT